MSQQPITVTVSVCVCVWVLKGRSRHKMEGTSPNHRTLAPAQRQKGCLDNLNLNSISPLSCSLLPNLSSSFSASLWTTKAEANKDSAQSNQANSANKLSVGSSLSVLTHFTVSVAKQRLKCLATRQHSILMEWLPPMPGCHVLGLFDC